MGAEPILDGGGEFALDIEAELIEAVSEMASLTGVLVRSRRADAMLGCRDVGRLGMTAEVAEEGVGASDLGVGTTRIAFGPVRIAGDCSATGVLAGSGGKALAGAGVVVDGLGVSGVGTGLWLAVAAAILRTAGVGFFSATFGVAAAFDWPWGALADFFGTVVEGFSGVTGMTSGALPFSSFGNSSFCAEDILVAAPEA